ncbi:hypothetical protein B0F90DRAFT_144362 [Multifurca ochricompacta]|uniref:Uncharacterized protein n=1 Tax=Multifurca ochricompacta TaxID=376703 RepID=A0AAD4MEC0_9AGAM|nr:hypothetical protein B0F90DRAFT_144362 [Multifurca ochricompacta]
MEHSVSFLHQLSPPETPKIFVNDEEFVDHDIYRGDPPPTSQTPDAQSVASHSSSSSVSSNSFRLAGGRLGALATRLERAITRWARSNWADSSSSLNSDVSSDSSRSSFRTANKSTRRKRRRPSLADTHQRTQSERAVAARVRAREINRRTVPREFNLYSSSPSYPSHGAEPVEGEEQRVVRAFSLDAILPRLENVLRKPAKSRRPRRRTHAPRVELDDSRQSHRLYPQQAHSAQDEASDTAHTSAPEEDISPPKAGKGKGKPRPSPPSRNPLQTSIAPPRDPDAGKPPQAWWLDVASPSWEDMRTLGRLLHLHPLTLEDILQQEPREKLELFPKLGYYFIVFRAIESSTAPERLEVVSQKTGSSQIPAYGVVNEIYVYLVVFRDGICTFHFSNISEHLDRVRGKLQTTGQTARRSSAWIAHGILDSIVDSFFPLVEEIEEQVMAMESVVFDEDSPGSTTSPALLPQARASRALPAEEKALPLNTPAEEKHPFFKDVASIKTTKTQFSLPQLTLGLMLRRMRRAFSRFFGLFVRSKVRSVKPSFPRTSFDLRRMARTRRLVTSVARVLATKPEVVAGIRKRLMTSEGQVVGDDAEVAIYLGDVQDHILTLQQSLVHYERMLSQSHPIYLQNLRVGFLRVRGKSDYAAFVLAIVSVVVLPPQVFIGIYILSLFARKSGC